jgi:hypothetical protein
LRQRVGNSNDQIKKMDMALALDQQPQTSNQPYRVEADVAALLERAAVGARFEESLEIESGAPLLHCWPSTRLALAGCKVQASVQLALPIDARGRVGFPKTPQARWPQELASGLLRSVKISITNDDDRDNDATLLQACGADLPCDAQQYHASVASPDVTYSVVWTLPISASIPLYTALAAELRVEPLDQWRVLEISLVPRYEVVEPRERAVTRLERVLMHRQPSASDALRVPLSSARLQRIEFGERNAADAPTPLREAALWRGDQVLLRLSDRALTNGIELGGLDCRGCELRIEFDSNDHLKTGSAPGAPGASDAFNPMYDRAAAMARFGAELREPHKTFALRIVAEQELLTSATVNAWQ